jgi:hypothetical protein
LKIKYKLNLTYLYFLLYLTLDLAKRYNRSTERSP